MLSHLSRTTENRNARLLLTGFALLLAIFYDVFFWKQELGIGFCIYIIVYVVGFVSLLYYFKQLKQKWSLLLLIPIFIQSIDVAVYNNMFVTGWLVIITLALLFIFSLVLPLQNPNKFRFSFLRIPLIQKTSIFFTKVGNMFSDLLQSKSEQKNQIAKKIGIALLISFPVLLIFAGLLSGADAIFSKWLSDIFNIHVQWNWVWRIIRTFFLTVLFGGLFYVVTGQEHVLEFKAKFVHKFDALIVGIILGLVNALFLAFVFIQIKYLFGSAHFVFDSGLSFAEYARAGFFQLVWVVALSALMMLIVYRSYSAHKTPVILTALQILLIVQVAVIAVSALKRMHLYQDAFGFTVLRLYVEWFIYCILALLAFAGVSILGRLPFWKFFYGSVIAAVLAVTLVASMNVDKMIATENVRRFELEGKTLDVAYLSRLSIDAWPTTLSAFYAHSDKFDDGQRESIEYIISRMGETLKKRDTFFEMNAGVRDARVYFNEKNLGKMKIQQNQNEMGDISLSPTL